MPSRCSATRQSEMNVCLCSASVLRKRQPFADNVLRSLIVPDMGRQRVGTLQARHAMAAILLVRLAKFVERNLMRPAFRSSMRPQRSCAPSDRLGRRLRAHLSWARCGCSPSDSREQLSAITRQPNEKNEKNESRNDQRARNCFALEMYSSEHEYAHRLLRIQIKAR